MILILDKQDHLTKPLQGKRRTFYKAEKSCKREQHAQMLSTNTIKGFRIVEQTHA